MSDDRKKVNIQDLDKAAVLATLFNSTVPGGLGFIQAQLGPSTMTIDDAREVMGREVDTDYGMPQRGLYFDYLFGRPLKVDLSGDEFDPWGFDRDNGGPGTAQHLIDNLRETGNVESEDLANRRKGLLLDRSVELTEIVHTETTVEDGILHLGGDDLAGTAIHNRDQQVERFLEDWRTGDSDS